MTADPIHPFLLRLNLGLDADARDIKRAYARELKLIDQEADLPGFQELRECYDVALRWAAWDAERKEQEALDQAPSPSSDSAASEQAIDLAPAPAAAPVRSLDDGLDALDIVLPPSNKVNLAKRDAPLEVIERARPAPVASQPDMPAENPEQLSLASFDRFAQACKVLGRGRIIDDVGLWETELRRRLNDDELVNLEARTIFEARVAHLLAGEWQAVNGPLFIAASTVFEWDGDRRRLQQFGYAGAFLYQAAEEAHMFEAQPPQDLEAQRQLLLKLRQPGAGPAGVTKRDQAYIERMIERFPSFLTLHANHEVVEQWRRHGKRPRPTPAQAAAPVVDTTPEPVLYGDTSKRRGFDKAWILFAVIAVAALVRSWQIHGASFLSDEYRGGQFMPPVASEPAEVPDGPYLKPESRRVERGNRPVTSAGPLDQKLVDAIGKDIRYKHAKDAQPGERIVKFDVFLDADGKVLGVNRVVKSMDPDWDKAVEAAIRRARPFPPEAGTKLSLQYSLTLTMKPRPAGKTPAEPPAPGTELSNELPFD